jgi:hypothetical protein
LSFPDRSGSIPAAPHRGGSSLRRKGEGELEASASIEVAKQTLLSGALILAIGIVTG